MSIREHIQLMEIYQIVAEGILLEFDTESFLNRARGIQSLIDRGGTEGEKAAAREAMRRFEIKANAEANQMSAAAKREFLQRFETIKSGGQAGQSNSGMNREAEQREKDRRSQARADAEAREWREQQREKRERDAAELRRKRDAEQARKDNSRSFDELNDMDDDEPVSPTQPRWKNVILFNFARYTNEKSDKVYGVFFDSTDKEYYTCWGKYGGKLTTKQQESLRAAQIIFNTKIEKGYRKVKVDNNVAGFVWNHLP